MNKHREYRFLTTRYSWLSVQEKYLLSLAYHSSTLYVMLAGLAPGFQFIGQCTLLTRLHLALTELSSSSQPPAQPSRSRESLTSSAATSSHELHPGPRASCLSNQSRKTLWSCPYAKTHSSLSLMAISNVHIFHLPKICAVKLFVCLDIDI